MSIYKAYTQEALDLQYNNRKGVPNFAKIVENWKQQSEALRQRFDFHRDLAYGSHLRERLDIFPASTADAPVQVFFHGGYWQAMDKDVFHFIVDGFIEHDVTTVMAAYPLAPQASMDEIVASCRQAVLWLYRNVAEYGGDRNRIYLSGHSAGGHIVAMLMATEWTALDGELPADIVKGGCAISGLFNLIPIQLSYLNEVLGMEQAEAERNSPVRLAPTSPGPLIVTVGDQESDEYHAQTQELLTVWSQQGQAITQVPSVGADHFSILRHLIEKDAPLRQAILKQMGVI